MKKISTFFAVFCAVLLLIAPRAPRAQTIAINSVSGTTFCAGDPLAVTFTATGTWGHKNAFTLQLSNDSGTFDNGFLNIGSLIDTLSGTFTINTTISASSSTHYRLRILAAVPYITSADNGTDIAIGTPPDWLVFYTGQPGGSVGTPVTFTAHNLPPDNGDDGQYTAFWDFGSGATPAKDTTTAFDDPINGLYFSEATTYATTGDKTILLNVVGPTGCDTTLACQLHIYDCSDPVIPQDAIVINSDTTITRGPLDSSVTYWVNPGVTLNLPDSAGHDGTITVFAESGSTISGCEDCMLYMKQGSVFTSSHGLNSVVFGDGASINGASNDFTLDCPNLTFDYTVAPPNVALGINVNESVTPTAPVTQIEISPNPTNGILTLQNIPLGANVMVMNVLGETVQTENSQGNTNLSLDLSNCAAGTYYVRIASGNSVTTKSIVKE
jgi:hypothetical protein